MTSTQIRQSFLNFFKSKQHTIVPSSSLMPDSPNLLFTNAGMNQFVPIFLGQTRCPYTPGRAADTQKCIRAGGKHNDLDDVGLDTYHHTFFEMLGNWSFGDYFKMEAIDWAWELVVKVWKFPPQRLYATVFCPYLGEPGWEQKWAIELEQVLVLAMTSPTYIPPNANASPFEIADQEAAMFWAKKFQGAGCDPKVHIVPGNKKDNFWMMGETGPCGPCTEIHVDLTPEDRTLELEKRGAKMVNSSDARCIEIWNNVFIQFNANPDGTFAPLPAKHVDTGMGFERVTSIIQGTKELTDFKNAKISNYETDIFRPIFDAIEKLSGKRYGSTLPLISREEAQAATADQAVLNDLAVIAASRIARGVSLDAWCAEMIKDYGDQVKPLLAPAWAMGDAQLDKEAQKVADSLVARPDYRTDGQQVAIDIAFRVIADHIRTLSFAIADGIQPGNTDRNYVLRRILRRAVRYGRTLGFQEPFFYKLVDVLAATMGDIFPEIRAKKNHVQDVIRIEEEAFNKTLDKGIILFETDCFRNALKMAAKKEGIDVTEFGRQKYETQMDVFRGEAVSEEMHTIAFDKNGKELGVFRYSQLTSEVLRTIFKSSVVILGDDAFKLYDTYGFPLDLTELMARERGLTVDKEGFEKLMEEQRTRARSAQKKEVIAVSKVEVAEPTKFVGYDELTTEAKVLQVVPQKDKTAVILDASVCYAEMGGQVGDTGELSADGKTWRVTNTQKSGSTFLHVVDGNDAPAVGTSVKLAVEKSRRDAIQRHHTVTHLLHWALHEVASKEASQKGSFVGPDKLTFDFNSAPLTPAQVADIEKLVNERIVENAGVSWIEVPHADVKNRKDVMQFFGDKYGDTVRVVQIGGSAHKLDGYSMELCGGTHTRATGEIGLFRIVGESAIAAGVRRIEAVAGLTAYDVMKLDRELIKTVAGKINSPIHELEKKIESLLAHQKALEKEVQIAMQRNASNAASELLPSAHTVNGIPLITHNLGDATGDFLQAIADALKGQFKGVVVLGGGSESAVTLIATVSADYTAKVQAGKIIQTIAPIVGGKGGGKPDNARGGGKDASKLDEALAQAKSLLG